MFFPKYFVRSARFSGCLIAILFLAFGLEFRGAPAGQDAAPADPLALLTKRRDFEKAVEKASVPLLTEYKRKLQPLKEALTRKGNLEAGLAVEREIKKTDEAIAAANTTGTRREIPPLAIADPPELIALRTEHLRALQKLSLPHIGNYVRLLEPIKADFTRRGDLESALAVDREIKKMKAEENAATATAGGARNTTARPIEIIKAIYQAGEDTPAADVTARVREVFASGAPTIEINRESMGVDPAPYKQKRLTLEWSVNGVLKKKTFAANAIVNFAKDLR